MQQTSYHSHVFETALGYCGIAWDSSDDTRILRFQLPDPDPASTAHQLSQRLGVAAGITMVPSEAPATVLALASATQRYFEGEAIDFSDIQLDLTRQTLVSQRIYTALRCVAWGKTTTYGALAKEIGLGPAAARSVGRAMATNPVPLIIPCHRVLAAGGKLGGFSAPGGTTTKVRMLELERVQLEHELQTQSAQLTLGLE